MEYVVTWSIDIEADSPLEAAREAKRIQVDPESIANVFRVSADNRVIHYVDLNDILLTSIRHK